MSKTGSVVSLSSVTHSRVSHGELLEPVFVNAETTDALAAAVGRVLRCFDILVEHLRVRYSIGDHMLDDCLHDFRPTTHLSATTGGAAAGGGRGGGGGGAAAAWASKMGDGIPVIPVSKPVSADCIGRREGGAGGCLVA